VPHSCAAINNCSMLILQADIDNAAERIDHRQDVRRLMRYRQRRTDLVRHREQLENLYASLYNEKPWANVPY